MRHLHAGIIRGKVICIRREIHSYARRKKPRYHLSCLPARLQKPLLLIINRRFALPPLSPLPLLLLPFRRRVILKFSPIGTPFYFDILFEIILFNFIILFNDSTICFGTIEFIYGKFQKRWILDFFLSIRLNIKIIRRVYIYRIIEWTEENRNSRGGNLLDCPGRKKLLDSGISVDYSPFHYSEPLGGILSCSLLPLLSKRFFFFC